MMFVLSRIIIPAVALIMVAKAAPVVERGTYVHPTAPGFVCYLIH